MGYYKDQQIMEEDYNAWKQMIENLYGKEYLEQLLKQQSGHSDDDDEEERGPAIGYIAI